ncbi:WD domain protein [Puccinia graminis f. sp. tritici]|uniref:WD domain protein n=1 Tax=Puccinia graminis f. sp. tritici TaxID=56615 RepID=A0A5B0R1T4_PUCGR|nr:WD domain protein [Puccinia graminis f. sp. tritici]
MVALHPDIRADADIRLLFPGKAASAPASASPGGYPPALAGIRADILGYPPSKWPARHILAGWKADPPNDLVLENHSTTTDDGVLQGSNHGEESEREDQELAKESLKNEPEDEEKEAEEERKLRGNQEAYARVTHTLKGHTRPISSLSFSPDGTKLSSLSADGVILIWKVILPEKPSSDRGGMVGHQVEFMSKLVDGALEDEENDQPREGINDLAWSPDSEYLVSGSDDHAIHVWAPSSQSLPSNPSSSSSSSSTTRPIRKLLSHSHCVYCVKFNPIGTLLISGSFDETVRELQDGIVVRSWVEGKGCKSKGGQKSLDNLVRSRLVRHKGY